MGRHRADPKHSPVVLALCAVGIGGLLGALVIWMIFLLI